MKINWRQGLTSTTVAGSTAVIVSVLGRHFGITAPVTSSLAIGVGIGASRLFAEGRNR